MEVKNTMKVAITAKRVVMLMMTMALAVAMVACQAATPKAKTQVAVGAALGDIEFAHGAGPMTIQLASHFKATKPTYGATSSKKGVATVSVSGAVLTVTPVAAGTANVLVTATATADDEEGQAAQRFTVTVNAPDPQPTNKPPTVRTISPVSLQDDGQKMIRLSDYFTDPEGDALTYTASSSMELYATAAVEGAMLTITAVAAGTAEITVSASDGTNDAVSQTFDVTVTTPPVVQPDNERPEQTLIDDIDDMRREGTRELDLSMYYDDPDGDDLTYDATSGDEMVVTESVSGSMLTITGVGVGTARITVTASDGTDEARQTFSVTVGSQAPEVDASLPTRFPLDLAGDTKVLNLSKYYDDPEGDDLTFDTVGSSDRMVATVTEPDANSMITITAVGPGSATITVTAADSDNDPVSLDFVVMVGAPAVVNEPPEIRAGMVDDKDLYVGDTVDLDLSMYFMDSDEGDTLKYTAESNDPAVTVTGPGTGSMITITAVSGGGATITITATDSHEESAKATFMVTVSEVPNTPPTLMPDMAAPTVTLEDSASWMRDVSGYFMDADGDMLTYSADSSDDTKATESVSGSMVTITAVAAGMATITVTASDGEDSVDLEIEVTVNPPPNNSPALTPGRSVPDVTLVLEDDPSWMRDVSGYFMDADGDALTYSADSSDDTKATESVSGSMVTITAVAEGTATITVTASDGEDSVDLIIYVTVDPAPVAPPENGAPQMKEGMPLPDLMRAAGAANHDIDLSMHFEDPEGYPLVYNVEVMNETPDTEGESVIVIVGPTVGTTPGMDTDATIPNGTDFDTMFAIKFENAGTVEIKITAIDNAAQKYEDSFMITVVASNASPVPTTGADLSDRNGAGGTTRMKIDEDHSVIGDHVLITTHFDDDNFVANGGTGDEITFSVKYLPTGTAQDDAVSTDALDADKVSVSANVMPKTWSGSKSAKITLSVTGTEGSVTTDPDDAAADPGHVVALIATDRYGGTAAKIFNVRVNNAPKAEGAQATDPQTLADASMSDDTPPKPLKELGFWGVDATGDNAVVNLVDDNEGYFHDPDGDTLACRIDRSSGDGEGGAVKLMLNVAGTVLTINPEKRGTASATISCVDTFMVRSPEATLSIEVTNQSQSRQ